MNEPQSIPFFFRLTLLLFGLVFALIGLWLIYIQKRRVVARQVAAKLVKCEVRLDDYDGFTGRCAEHSLHVEASYTVDGKDYTGSPLVVKLPRAPTLANCNKLKQELEARTPLMIFVDPKSPAAYYLEKQDSSLSIAAIAVLLIGAAGLAAGFGYW